MKSILTFIIGMTMSLAFWTCSPNTEEETKNNQALKDSLFADSLRKEYDKKFVKPVILNADINLKTEKIKNDDESAFVNDRTNFLYITNNDTFIYKRIMVEVVTFNGENPYNRGNLPYVSMIKTALAPKETIKFKLSICNTGLIDNTGNNDGPNTIHYNPHLEHLKHIEIEATDTSLINNRHYVSMTRGYKTIYFNNSKE